MALKALAPSSICSSSSQTTTFSLAPAASSSRRLLTSLTASVNKPHYTALTWAPILPTLSNSSSSSIDRLGAASSPTASVLDESDALMLASIRDSLIRQEDSIIFSLIERAQYKLNSPTYDANRFSIPGFKGSLIEFILQETEKLHAKALSKRIHYGKFVAEAKFRESPELFESAIRAQDEEALMRIITYESVEQKVQKRVELKARTYGQEIDFDESNPSPQFKIQPSQVANLYGEWVMPLTKKVQVQYLLRRLD